MKIKARHRRRIDSFIRYNGEVYRRLIMQAVERAQIGLLDVDEVLEDQGVQQPCERRMGFGPLPDSTTRFLRVELTKTRACENALAALAGVAA